MTRCVSHTAGSLNGGLSLTVPFSSLHPPPTSPATPPSPPPLTPYRPALVNSPRRQRLEAFGLGMPGVYPTVRSEDHNTWELIDLGGGGGWGRLSHSPHRGQHMGTHRLGICGVYPTVHTEDNGAWELSDLGYVGFIPQSTQRTMALGNPWTQDVRG